MAELARRPRARCRLGPRGRLIHVKLSGTARVQYEKNILESLNHCAPADWRNGASEMHILLIYSTTDGHTRQICQRLKKRLELSRDGTAVRVTSVALGDVSSGDLASFDKIVVGASIRYGKHRPELLTFLQQNASLLNARPNAFFTVNLVARKPEKCRPDNNPYMRKLLERLSWRPRQLAVFAGKIDYPQYGFFDRQMIRFIMWLTNGPTGRNDVIDFTDWAAVDAFADAIIRM